MNVEFSLLYNEYTCKLMLRKGVDQHVGSEACKEEIEAESSGARQGARKIEGASVASGRFPQPPSPRHGGHAVLIP